MSPIKPRVPNAISKGGEQALERMRGVSGGNGIGVSEQKGKPSHDFGTCIACAACSTACDPRAIRIFIDEDEGMLVWTLDLFDCTWCGRRATVCPTGAMAIISGSDFADDPEPPKRCLFALRECESCGRYYATNKEVDYANALLDQQEHDDAAHARTLTGICPDCKRTHDAKAAARRSGMRRKV